VALSIGTALIWREQQKTRAQKQLAEENYRLARDMGFQSLNLIESAEASFAAVPRLDATRKELLIASSRAFRHYLEQEPDDPELRRRTAQVYRYTANVLRQTSQPRQAEELYRDAIGLLEGLCADDPGDRDDARKLAETLRDQASLQARQGQLGRAADSLRQALAVHERLLGETPARAPASQGVAISLLDLSQVEHRRGQIAAATKTAQQAVDLLGARAVLPAGKGHPYDPLLLAAGLNQVGIGERDQGRPEQALKMHARALEVLKGLLARPRAGLNRNDALHVQAQTLLEEGRARARSPASRASAEKRLGLAVRQWELLARGRPQNPLYRHHQAVACQARGQVRAALNRRADALADLQVSRKLLEELVKESPDVASYHGDLGRAHLELARLARAGGANQEMASWLHKAIASLRQAVELAPEIARNQQSLKQAVTEGGKK
jgi:tetratricopeptide (TPR) repeat protein